MYTNKLLGKLTRMMELTREGQASHPGVIQLNPVNSKGEIEKGSSYRGARTIEGQISKKMNWRESKKVRVIRKIRVITIQPYQPQPPGVSSTFLLKQFPSHHWNFSNHKMLIVT